jgi:hypothetical protein
MPKHKKGKKRKLPPVLRAWKDCRDELKIKPFVKMTKNAKREAQRCVDKKLARMRR